MEDQDTLDHQDRIAEICKLGRGIDGYERFHVGVIEAFRNAYQHGNRKDPNKNIQLAYRRGSDYFEVVVSDEGGEIDSNFAPFVLLHRQGLERPLSFYDFAPDVEKPTENSGIGTFTMHMVAHEVRYWLNKWGGLSVQLRLLNNKGTAAPVIGDLEG